MIPKQKNTYILDIKNMEIFYLPFYKEAKHYYNHYFDINWINIKNTWKGIKSILSVFSSALKIAKVVPLHKRDSKLDFSKY